MTLRTNASALESKLLAENVTFPVRKNTKHIANRVRRTLRTDVGMFSQTKAQFLSLISHELHTPLQSIIGFSQLLMLDMESRSPLSADQKESVQHIYQSGRQLLEQVDLLLELSQLKSGALELQFEKVDVDEVLNDLYPMMEELSYKHNVKVTIKEHAEACVYVNYKKLKQIFKYLFINIFKLGYVKETIYIGFEYLDTHFLRVLISEKADVLSQRQTPDSVSILKENEIGEAGFSFDIVQCLTEKMAGHFGFKIQPDVDSLFWLDLPVFDVN